MFLSTGEFVGVDGCNSSLEVIHTALVLVVSEQHLHILQLLDDVGDIQFLFSPLNSQLAQG